MTLFTKKTLELSTVLFVAVSVFFSGQENWECFGFFSISSVNSTSFAISGKIFAKFLISQN
jgi:hypothetical protein